MQRICVFGAKNAPFINTLDTRQKLRLSGNNFGNYLIGYAIDRQIKNCDFYDFCDSSIAIEEINEKYDKAVIASSNFLNSLQDLTKWANVLEKLDMPIIAIGLGAQALNESEKIILKKGTRRFIDIVSEKSKSIGVRGEYTALLLNKLGIYNVDIVGCPTCFMNLDKEFQIKNIFDLDNLSKIVIHGNPRKEQQFYIEHLLNIFSKYNSYYLIQTEISLIQKDPFKIFNKNNLGDFEQNILLNKSVYFDNILQWRNFYRDVSLSIRGRFHGNMIAMMSGVPSIWITHDTRTRELVNFLNLPNISIENIISLSIEDIVSKYSTYIQNFNTKYSFLYDNYISFLNKNNLQHVLR